MGGVGFDSVQGIGPLLWAFGANYDFQVKDGKVIYGPITEEFEKGLAYIANLYREGLIDPDYLLDTRAKLDAKFTADTTGFKFGFQPTTYYASMNDGRKVSGIPYLVAEDGEKYCFNLSYAQPVNSNVGLAVSVSNKNVAGTLKWLDILYGEEGLRYANYGKEGETYTIVNGEEVFTDAVLHPSNGKTSANMIALTAAVRDSAFPMGQTWQFYKQTLAPWGIEAVETWIADNANIGGVVPQITMSAEENVRYSDIMNTVKTYMQEAANKVITGRSSIDEWGSVVQQMKTMGIGEAVLMSGDPWFSR
jgi:putative aldouronate transport system substrate-binding protein